MALALKRQPQVFDRSKLKDSYRHILDQAKADGAVLIRDNDDENLYIVRADVFGALDEAREEAQDFVQLAAAIESAVSARRPIRALDLGRLSWAADLTQQSFRQFVREYFESVHRAVNSSSWGAHHQFLIEWRDTAEVERDPDLMGRLLEPRAPDEELVLERPILAD